MDMDWNTTHHILEDEPWWTSINSERNFLLFSNVNLDHQPLRDHLAVGLEAMKYPMIWWYSQKMTDIHVTYIIIIIDKLYLSIYIDIDIWCMYIILMYMKCIWNFPMYVIPSYIPMDIVPFFRRFLGMGGSGVSPGEPWVATTFGGESLRKNYGETMGNSFFW